jgi:eukaryotic-like serine/threonine-protein kinase
MEPQDTIFLRSRDIADPVERAAYLTQACGNDADLRQRVETMLRDAAGADAFFGPEPAGATVIEGPGTVIGRYKLLQKIGEGGMGLVYMAEQREPVMRKVALKIIKLGMDTKQVVARFEAERQALALMDHPNIAKVLEAGATETGRPYFVMELVRGIKITDYCDENNLSTVARLELFIQVCQAIQHAHQKGIIHRDIKPSNILVADHDGVPVPKIIDFGIAKATTDQRLTDKTLFTAFEQFIGTPAYMSPEQAKLSGLDIDTRSDIYSLGVLLYELLTAKTPFEANRLHEIGLDEIRRIIREEEPVKPSTKLQTLEATEQTTVAKHRQSDPPKLAHLIRGDLDWIVMKALEKDRGRRYETANGLAMDIKRHMENEPVQARPPSAGYRLQKTWRRNKTAFAVATLIAAILMAATAISAWQAVRATQAMALAKKRLAESEANATLAQQRLADSEAVSKFLTEVFQSPDPARNGRTITVAETLGAAAKKLETDLGNQPARRAKLQTTLGSTYYALGLYPEAIALQEQIRAYYLATFGLEDTNTLAAMYNLAMSYRVAGRLNEAIKLSEETLTLRRKTLGLDNTNTLVTMNNLANSYRDAGRLDEAFKLCEQILPLASKLFGPENPRTLSAMGNLANSYYDAGRLDESMKLDEQVLSLDRKVNGAEHPATLTTMNNLAKSYFDAGRKDEALKLREEILTLSRKVLGPEHPNTLMAMNNLMDSYDDAERKDEAHKLIEETLMLSRKVLGPEHPTTLGAMVNLANSYASLGRQAEALKLGEQALPLYRKALGPEHPATLLAMTSLAYFYDQAGRKDEALKLREEALTLSRKVLGPENPNTLAAMNYLVNSYDDAGRKDEAFKLREEKLTLSRKALTTQRSTLGSDSPAIAATLLDMASLLKSQNRPGEAVHEYRESMDIILKTPFNEGLFNLSSTVFPELVEAGERQQVSNICRMVLNSTATNAAWFNSASWSLATTENPSNRNPALAVELAQRAVQINPHGDWNTVGVAYYRAGDFKEAIADLEKAMRNERGGGTSYDFFFQAMAEHQVGNADAARRFYAKATQWMKEHDPRNSELLRFQAEAERLLGEEVDAKAENHSPVPSTAK